MNDGDAPVLESRPSGEGAGITPMQLLLASIERNLASMNERLTNIEARINNPSRESSPLGSRSSRKGFVLGSPGHAGHRSGHLSGQATSSFRHGSKSSSSLRRGGSTEEQMLLPPERVRHEDSLVMIQLKSDKDGEGLESIQSPRARSSRFPPANQESGSSHGSPHGSLSSRKTESDSPHGANLTSNGSLVTVSEPAGNDKQNSKAIHSFAELVTFTRVKRQIKAKSHMLPALHEHSTLDDSTSLYRASEFDESGVDLERNISVTSAPSEHASSPRTQSLRSADEETSSPPKLNLVAKSTSWMQRSLAHLSQVGAQSPKSRLSNQSASGLSNSSHQHQRSQSHPQDPQSHEKIYNRSLAVHKSSEMRLQMFNQGLKRVEQLSVTPVMVLKWIFWDVLDPDRYGTRAVRIFWDFVMLGAMLYILIATPFTIGFNIDTINVSSSSFAAFDLFINCVLMTDILIQFRTPYRDEDVNLVTDRYLIAKHYVLSGWLLVDVPSSLPWDNMFQDPKLTVLKLLRLVRISHTFYRFRDLKLRNLRGFQEQNILFILETILGSTLVSLLKLLFLSILIVHWACCIFYWCASWNNFSINTWVYRQGLVPGTWNGVTTEDTASLGNRYLYSLYFTVVTMATVGYGDITPIASVEKVIDIFLIFIGITLFGLLMGLMAQAVSNSSVREARISQRRQLVQDFIKSRHLPKEIADQVVRFYLFRATKEIAIEEKEIIGGLPNSLRDQVIEVLYIDLVMKFEFFANALAKHPSFLSSVIQNLKRELYIPGDDIVRQGEIGRAMYFISEGRCEIRVNHASQIDLSDRSSHNMRLTNKENEAEREDKLTSKWGPLIEGQGCYLEEGCSFGCYTCLLEEPRAATVLATLYSEVFCLSRSDLEKIIEEWPGLAEEFEAFIEQAEMRTEFDV